MQRGCGQNRFHAFSHSNWDKHITQHVAREVNMLSQQYELYGKRRILPASAPSLIHGSKTALAPVRCNNDPSDAVTCHPLAVINSGLDIFQHTLLELPVLDLLPRVVGGRLTMQREQISEVELRLFKKLHLANVDLGRVC